MGGKAIALTSPLSLQNNLFRYILHFGKRNGHGSRNYGNEPSGCSKGNWDFKEATSNNEIERELFDLFNNLDFDARWVKKGSQSFFGYKDHVKCDRERKIITDFSVTDASVHDVQEPEDLVLR